MFRKTLFVIIGLILLISSFIIGYKIGGKKTENITKSDTVKVFIPTEFKKTTNLEHIKAKHTTIYITKTDTLKIKDSVKVDVASMDTTITDSVSTIKMKVKYFSKPLDYFDIKSSISYRFSKEQIFITKYVIPEEKWYSRLSFGAGLGYSLTNEMKVCPSINVGFYYRIW